MKRFFSQWMRVICGRWQAGGGSGSAWGGARERGTTPTHLPRGLVSPLARRVLIHRVLHLVLKVLDHLLDELPALGRLLALQPAAAWAAAAWAAAAARSQYPAWRASLRRRQALGSLALLGLAPSHRSCTPFGPQPQALPPPSPKHAQHSPSPEGHLRRLLVRGKPQSRGDGCACATPDLFGDSDASRETHIHGLEDRAVFLTSTG